MGLPNWSHHLFGHHNRSLPLINVFRYKRSELSSQHKNTWSISGAQAACLLLASNVLEAPLHSQDIFHQRKGVVCRDKVKEACELLPLRTDLE